MVDQTFFILIWISHCRYSDITIFLLYPLVFSLHAKYVTGLNIRIYLTSLTVNANFFFFF